MCSNSKLSISCQVKDVINQPELVKVVTISERCIWNRFFYRISPIYLHLKGSKVRCFLQFYLMASHITSFTVAGLLILSTSMMHTMACFLHYVGFLDEVTFSKVNTFVVTIQVFIVELWLFNRHQISHCSMTMCHHLLDRSAVHQPTQRVALFFTIFKNNWIMILQWPSTPTIIVLDNLVVQVFFRLMFFLIRGMEAPLSYYVCSDH